MALGEQSRQSEDYQTSVTIDSLGNDLRYTSNKEGKVSRLLMRFANYSDISGPFFDRGWPLTAPSARLAPVGEGCCEKIRNVDETPRGGTRPTTIVKTLQRCCRPGPLTRLIFSQRPAVPSTCEKIESSPSPVLRAPSPPKGARELTVIFSSPRLRFGGEGQGEGATWLGSKSIVSQLPSPGGESFSSLVSPTLSRKPSIEFLPTTRSVLYSPATRSFREAWPWLLSSIVPRAAPSPPAPGTPAPPTSSHQSRS
jgi:hypothetical protein